MIEDHITMQGYEASKTTLLESMRRIQQVVGGVLPDSVFLRELEALQETVEEDLCTVVVLGEFKRGKSTFINGLLGEALLPVDVTPTTATINAVLYGEQRNLTVHWDDGTAEQRELNKESIDAFSVEGTESLKGVRYLRLTMPVKMLEPNVILVDTPGVNDLNKQRSEVTYRFIPRADVVIFMLDATSPVTRSEKEFLSETFLSEGLERILFIANFIDQIEEEQSVYLDSLGNRLAAALGGRKQTVLPYCGTMALEGRQSNDVDQLEASGYPAIIESIQKLIQHGSQGEVKLERFRSRMQSLVTSIGREIEGRHKLLSASGEELDRKLEGMEILMERHGAIRAQMDIYTKDRETEMLAILRKSLLYFEQHIKEDMEFAVIQFSGTQLKEFVETHITMQIKRRFKQWIEQHSPAMIKMLQMLENQLVTALAKEFNTALHPLWTKSNLEDLNSSDSEITLTGADLSNTPIMAGLIAGGAGMLAMLLGGPLFLPIVGMAGFPFIQKHMMQDQLKKAKEKLLPELAAALDQVMEQFGIQVEQWLLTNIKLVRDSAENRYVEIVRVHKIRLESDISGMKHSLEEKQREKQRLLQVGEEISLWHI
ncbi:dynamin family protein [Paenibacillus wynnii]|uniref:dynamin family protein n=1 Tax=Paenibacillus wynnii TaxID=268407 RepID=UPI0027D8BB98|nr:dynamin family protein [Paenibacillus wynnii]